MDIEQESLPLSLRFPVFSEDHKTAIGALQRNMNYYMERYNRDRLMGCKQSTEIIRSKVMESIAFADASLNVKK